MKIYDITQFEQLNTVIFSFMITKWFSFLKIDYAAEGIISVSMSLRHERREAITVTQSEGEKLLPFTCERATG